MKQLLDKIAVLFKPKESAKVSSPLKDVCTGVFVSLIIAIVSVLGVFQKFEYLTLDGLFRLRGQKPAHESIVIAGIDDKSLEILGRWPWPREYHADFLRIVNKYGPRQMVFDILFPETDAGGDEALAAAAKENDNLYLASYFTLGNTQAVRPAGSEDASRYLPALAGAYEGARFYSASELTLPVKMLRDAAKRSCAINAPADSDGATRRLPLVVEFDKKLYPTLSLQLACDRLGVDVKDVVIKPGSVIIPLRDDEIRVPVDRRGRMLLNFSGPVDTFKLYSYIQLLHDYDRAARGERADSLEGLADKIVFVGQVATGTVDLRITPFSNLYPAVGLHATAVGNILGRDMMRELPAAYNFLVILLIGTCVSASVRRGKKAYVNLGIMALAVLSYAIFSFLAFVLLKLWIHTFTPLIAVVAVYVAVSLSQYEAVRHEKKMLENELLIARTIQQSFLPKSYPAVPFLEFAATCIPAKHIGGDLYDFVQLDDDRIGVLIGDVSGKGVPAALYMARAVSEFRRQAQLKDDAPSTLEAVNDDFVREGMQKSFITMQYLVFELKAKRCLFSNGGHNTVLHFIQKDKKIEELDTKKGMPIGVMEGVEFDSREVPFEKGDLLFLYSDGISEAMDKKNREFGIDRVKDILAGNHESKAGDIMEKILSEIAGFSKGAPQHDDMTLIVIKAV